MVIYDLNKSEYTYRFLNHTFYFSSQFNAKRFEERLTQFINEESEKYEYRYNCKLVSGELIFAVKLYRNIEKRGFRLTNKDGIDITTPLRIKIEVM